MAKIFDEFDLRPGSDHGVHAGARGAGKQARRLPGLRPPDDRLPAGARPGRPLRQRLPADPAAAGQAAPDRRRRLARLGLGLCAGQGHDWVDFDPTNNLLPDTEHITLAFGRDFGDISPLRGIILGGGGTEPEVAVTVFRSTRKKSPRIC
jgi:hypothetical protein